MANTLVLFASNAQVETPQVGASDRAAIGLAVSRFAGHVSGCCPLGDAFAMTYGAAAGLAKLEPLAMPLTFDFEVALVGQCALTEFGDELAGTLSEEKGATLVFDVLDVHREGSTSRIVKDAGQGNREEWLVSGSVVMVISAEAVRPPYVSRYRRMMAVRNQPKIAAEPHNAIARPAAEWEAVRLRAKIGRGAESLRGLAEDRMSAAFGIATANSPSANDRLIMDDAATCARHLLRYLAHHSFLPEGLGKALPGRQREPVAATSSKPKLPPASSQNVSMSRRTARGPRVSDDSPVRLARRPRIVTVPDKLPTNTPLQRGPRPLGRSPDGLARRPRKLDD